MKDLLIMTKPIHVEKIVNYMNKIGMTNYNIITEKGDIESYDFDIAISYCYPYIVKIIPGRKYYNYHPGPLPEYPGIYNYSKAINLMEHSYGVTLHVMTEEVDKGKVIKKKMFNLDSTPIHSNELGTITHYKLFQLFKETIKELIKNG